MEKKSKSHIVPPSAPKNVGGWKGKIYRFAEKFKPFTQKFEQVVNTAAVPLPSPRIKLWLAGFFHPEETYEKVEKDATLVGLAGNLIIFYIASSFVLFLIALALISILSPEDMMQYMGLQQSPDIAAIAIDSLILSPIVITFFAMFAFALVFLSARMLGGKGTYVKQANSMTLVLCGNNTLLLVLMCLVRIISLPSFLLRDAAFTGTIVSIATAIVNIPVLLLCLAVFLYSIYAYYLVIKKAHNLSMWRTIGVILITAVFVLLVDAAVRAILRS